MKNTVKKIICVIIAAAAALSLLPAAAAGDDFTVSVSDGELLSGIAQLIFYSPSEEGCAIALDGNAVAAEEVGAFELCCTAGSVDYTNSSFFAGDTLVGRVSANGLMRYKLDASLIKGGTMLLTFLPSAGSGLLDTEKVYGTYNIDDLTISDIYVSLPSGAKVRPNKLRLYYPIQGEAGKTESVTDYFGAKISIGDGWNSNTGLGGATPDQPVYFTLEFDFTDADISAREGKTLRAEIDTSAYADGAHELTFSSAGGEKKVSVIFDNTAPVISCSLASGSRLPGASEISVTAEDICGSPSVVMKIDGKIYTGGAVADSAAEGLNTHTFTAVATDSRGNASAFAASFTVASDSLPMHEENLADGSTVTADSGTLLGISDAAVTDNGDGTYTVAAGSAEKLLLSFTGTTSENTSIALSALNNETGKYERFALAASGETLCAELTVKPEYLKDGKITVKAAQYVYESESDTAVWISDTQYYTRYADLLDKYKADLDYYASLYAEGKAGFLIHTGDVADEYSPEAAVRAQLKAASDLHAALDAAGIPYGIVDGNHDVGQSKGDASYFCEYFGASRFADSSWYYGSLNNNESHYDLVSLGGYDFVLLWLGYGSEATPETLAWANDVLARYSERNAIILTHAYLDTDADWVLDYADPDNYTHSRAPEIWESIVVPNSNVVAVFCGHTPGVSRNLRKVDSSRSVWEILSDYQFYENGTDPQHILNGCTCDGEGYVRLVAFTGAQMIQKTYSPVYDDWNAFSADKDEFTVSLTLKPSVRTLTVGGFSAWTVSSEATLDGSAVPASGRVAVIARTYTLSEPETPSEPAGAFPWAAVLAALAAATIIAAAAAVIIKKKRAAKK